MSRHRRHATHQPTPYGDIVEALEGSLSFSQMMQEDYAVSKNGMKMSAQAPTLNQPSVWLDRSRTCDA